MTDVGTVLAAPDKFRGSATAVDVVAAVCRAVEAVGATCVGQPMSDGGEGLLDALGGPNRVATVTGPLGDPVEAPWRRTRDEAVIEMATASGLALVGGAARNDAIAAATHGTGELLSAALDAGCRRVIVGLGGSASTDGGLGAVRAIEPRARLSRVDLVVACDVTTRFLDAAAEFAPQKGATPAQVDLLRRRLERLAQVYDEEYGVDVRDLVGAGSAGGLAGGLAALGAELVPGFDLVADEVGLDDKMAAADLVVTGEGFLDRQSFDGKVVGGVADMAAAHGVEVLAVVGGRDHGVEPPPHVTVVALEDEFGSRRAWQETTELITEVVRRHLDLGSRV